MSFLHMQAVSLRHDTAPRIGFWSVRRTPTGQMLMTAPPGKAVWRRGLASTPPEFLHPSMETIRTSIIWRPNSPSSPRGPNSPRSPNGCSPQHFAAGVLSPAPSRCSPSKQTIARRQAAFAVSSGSASSVSPSCHAAGFGLGSSRGANDYMPYALAPDTAFFKEVIRSERRACSRAAQQRQFGRVASSAHSQVDLAAAFPMSPCRPTAGTITAFPTSPRRHTAGTYGPFASVVPPSRPSYGSTGNVFQRG